MKIVVTGGPCAGKTTLIQILGRVFNPHFVILPEAASLLFAGGFPRWAEPDTAKSTQRAIYGVQCHLEEAFQSHYPERSLILDRGTLDGSAYWPTGPEDFLKEFATDLAGEFARYDHVVYLQSAGEEDYRRHRASNPMRLESWEQAARIDSQLREIWSQHPSFHEIPNHHSFESKITRAVSLMKDLTSPRALAG